MKKRCLVPRLIGKYKCPKATDFMDKPVFHDCLNVLWDPWYLLLVENNKFEKLLGHYQFLGKQLTSCTSCSSWTLSRFRSCSEIIKIGEFFGWHTREFNIGFVLDIRVAYRRWGSMDSTNQSLSCSDALLFKFTVSMCLSVFDVVDCKRILSGQYNSQATSKTVRRAFRE